MYCVGIMTTESVIATESVNGRRVGDQQNVSGNQSASVNENVRETAEMSARIQLTAPDIKPTATPTSHDNSNCNQLELSAALGYIAIITK